MALQDEEIKLGFGGVLANTVKGHGYANTGRGVLRIELIEISGAIFLVSSSEIVENVRGDGCIGVEKKSA